jgi:hypothetical protein
VSLYDPPSEEPRRVAYAVVPGEDEICFIAQDSEVLTRVVILQLVAQLRPDQVSHDQVERIRSALRGQDWQEAIIAWMDATGRRLNLFPDEPVWTASALDEDQLRLDLPLMPIFASSEAT